MKRNCRCPGINRQKIFAPNAEPNGRWQKDQCCSMVNEATNHIADTLQIEWFMVRGNTYIYIYIHYYIYSKSSKYSDYIYIHI